MRYGLSLTLALAAALAVVAASAAEPGRITAKQAEAQRVLSEIETIDMQLDRAVDAYDSAKVRLGAIERDLNANQRRLEIARANLADARRRVAARVVALYRSDEPDALTVLLGATSLGDLIDRLDSVNRISSEDARIAAEVTRYRDEVRARERRLEEARTTQQRVVAERSAQRVAIETQLAERRTLLSSIKDEIAKLHAEERARQARLAAAARARVSQTQQSKSNGQSEQTSPPASSPSPPPATSPPPPSSPPPSSPPPSGPPPQTHGGVVGIALQYLGVPYRWGGASPSGFDCSGFVMYVFAKVGVYLPHSSYMQFHMGRYVPRSELQPGDVVFFNGASHEGIYIGGGQFVHAPHTGDVVKISSLYEGWYSSTYSGARRF
ncbi:MAG TPA: NlpC/P60 family protein [Gaiellaceae bacterium]|jgi:cell wall-associated NlpC family hydrolase|nr:NlpC/P60 family protein [Gaiellaceae bacterium]